MTGSLASLQLELDQVDTLNDLREMGLEKGVSNNCEPATLSRQQECPVKKGGNQKRGLCSQQEETSQPTELLFFLSCDLRTRLQYLVCLHDELLTSTM